MFYPHLRCAGGGPLSLKRRDPLYLNKEGSGDNITNHMLWNMMIGAPLVAILASAVGYLATAQALLARLETSVAIWFCYWWFITLSAAGC